MSTPFPIPAEGRRNFQLRADFLLFFALAVTFCAVLRLTTLGYPALSDPSEGRYAAIGQDMFQSQDWITQQTHSKGETVPFLGKPPLHAWLLSTSYALLGMSEFSARLPSFLANLVSCAAMAFFAATLLDLQVAVLALMFLLSAYLSFVFAASCLIDPILGACVSCTFMTFAFALEYPRAEHRRAWGLAFFFTLGLSMLTKGPVGVVIPAIGIGLWLLYTRRMRSIAVLPWVGGISLFFLTWIPWYLLAELHNPGFLKYFFLNENLLRFLVKNYGDRYGSGHRYPYGMIWLMLLGSFLPWILLPVGLPQAVKSFRYQPARFSPWLSYSLLWGLAPCLLFTFARQISMPYVVPALPGIALSVAIVVRQAMMLPCGSRLPLFFKANIALSTAVSIALLGFGFYSGEEVETGAFSVIVLASTMLFGLIVYRFRRKGFWELAAVSTFSTAAMMTLILLNIDDRLDAALSAKAVVQYVEAHPDDSSELGFLIRAPHSAYFYARDVAAGLDVETVRPEDLEKTNLDYIAAQKKELQRIPVASLSRYRMIKDFGQWVLFTRVS